MDILLWLLPSVVVTVVAMLWVAWLGRERAEDVDRDAAVARLAKALSTEHPGRHQPRPQHPARDRSRGVAVRPSRVSRGNDQRRAS